MKTIKNIKLSTISTLFSCFFCTVLSFAQQETQYTQYMYNYTTINPAYAGSRGLLSINTMYRYQWAGLNGAPKTLMGSFNTPMGKGNVGLGVSFLNEEIGPSKENNLAIDFSYTIPISDYAKLAFGIKGGGNLYSVDFLNSTLNYDPNDPNVININNKFSPIFGAGFYFFNETWYLGLSSPNLLETKHYNDNVLVSTVSERAVIYFSGGYVFDLDDGTKFKPTILVKETSGAPMAIDVSANFLFNDKFTLGAAYRLDAAVSLLAGFQVSDQIMIGYAYDYDTTDFGNYSSGSHEIFMRFELHGYQLSRYRIPRFF